MADIFLTNVEAVIEVQDEGAGNGARNIVDLSTGVKPALGGFNKSFGAITRGYRLSPRTNKPIPLPVRRDQPEAITPELTCKMIAANYMEKFGADSRFALYVRHPAQYPSDPLDYVRVDILTDVAVDGFNFGDFVADEPNTDTITLTVPLNAANHVRILPVIGKALSTSFSSANDCDVVAADIDDEGTVFAVTAADAVGLKPFLLKSDDDGATWSEIELTDLSVDCTAIAVAGDYLVIAAGTTLAVYDKSGSQLGTYTAAGVVNDVAAIDAANIVAVGAAGLVLVSEDGGYNWTALTSGTSEGLN
ncbi:MAG TPA: hypothetical protein EYP90_14675, partial [Chromatiaceae bacterium]|nr:hypothetical protein [Chromatiaceae bacterium]